MCIRDRRTIATVNHKGGSGKTTTAVSLSAALAETGRHVLLIDFDPQASASAWVAAPTESRTLLDALLGGARLSDAVHHTGTLGLDIVPSSMWLLGAERRLAEIRAGEGRLAQLIGDLPDRWDYLVVDCPPALGALTANALASVEELFIPVEAHVMAVALSLIHIYTRTLGVDSPPPPWQMPPLGAARPKTSSPAARACSAPAAPAGPWASNPHARSATMPAVRVTTRRYSFSVVRDADATYPNHAPVNSPREAVDIARHIIGERCV